MRALIIIFIALCLIRKSIQKVEFYKEKTTSRDEILCVKTVFRKYFNDHSNVFIFSAKPNDIVNSLPGLPHFVATQSDSVRKISSVNRGAMIIFLEGNAEKDFTDLKRLLSIVTVQPVLVVCITNAVCSSRMYINEIVKMVNGVQLHYVAMDDEEMIDMYEYTTTAEGNCGVAQLVRLGRCSDKSIAKKAFQTPVNFHECPMRVVTRSIPPYSEQCSSGESNDFCGIEGPIVKSIIRLVNATPVSVRVQDPEDIRQLAAHRYADLGFGKLHTTPRDGASLSMAYLIVQATIVVPRSTWTFSGAVRNVLLPLNFEVWVGLGVVIVSMFILRILVPYFRRIHPLQLFGMILGISVPRQPRRLPSRIFFLFVVFFGYISSQSYLANLTKVFSTSRQPMINTLDDLENSNLSVGGLSGARKFFKDEYPRIYRDFQVIEDLEYDVAFHELLTGKSNLALYVEATDLEMSHWKELKRINDRISWFPIGMVVPKSSAVLETTNKFLASIYQAGLLEKYLSTYTSKNQMYYSPFSRYSGSKSLGEPIVLDLEELQAVFCLLIAGLSLSFLVFLIEIMTPFIKRKMSKGLKRRGNIPSEWLRQRHVRGILVSKQISRVGRR